jgi:hypothetical protein
VIAILRLNDGSIHQVEDPCGGASIFDHAFSIDGTLLALVCGSDAAASGSLAVLDLASASVLHHLAESAPFHSVAISPNGTHLAAGTAEGEIVLINALTGEEMFSFGEPLIDIVSLAFTPDSRSIVSGSKDGIILRWSIIPEIRWYSRDAACPLLVGDAVHTLEGGALWPWSSVIYGPSSSTSEGTQLYVLRGPRWGRILKNTYTYGWFWQLGYHPAGPSAGWLPEGSIQECE